MTEPKTETKSLKGFNTIAAQTYSDDKKGNRPLSIPIVAATTYQVDSSERHGELYKEIADTFYARIGNPTRTAAAKKIAKLEGAEEALIFSSGMGAITTSLMSILYGGAHVVAQGELYAQTFSFFELLRDSFGVEVDFIDMTDLSKISELIRTNTTLIYIESPSNPLLKIADIRSIADIASKSNISLFVDSTFASPYLQNPISLGATLSLHSGTKYLGGHSDLLCGVVSGNKLVIEKILQTQLLLGTILDPHSCWLLLRSIKSLGIRVQAQCDTALKLAEFLEDRPEIIVVNYPWLPSSPYYDLARKQMRGGGGVISFEVKGGLTGARSFVDALKLIPIATSLGGLESVIEIPSELKFAREKTEDAVYDMGVKSNLIRLSVGIEDFEDLKADLAIGLSALNKIDLTP